MKKQILSEELKRMKQLAGLISENEYNDDESTSSMGRIGKNYPDELEGEYEGEPETLAGIGMADLLYDILDISNSEDDFVDKVAQSITDETSSISNETEQKLRNWYKRNA